MRTSAMGGGAAHIGAGIRVLELVRSAIACGQHAACAWHGHEWILHASAGRLCLRCLVCGVETHGWSISVAPALRSHATTSHPATHNTSAQACEPRLARRDMPAPIRANRLLVDDH